MSDIIVYDKYLKITESCTGPFRLPNDIDDMVGKENAIFPQILAATVGTSKNFNRYTSESLKGSSKKNDHGERCGYRSFMDIYPKPILLNHDTEGDILGRVVNSTFIDNKHIIVEARISDWKYIDKVQEGDYLSVSIGFLTDSAICSICGHDVYKTRELCDHIKGRTYGKKLCVWEVGNMWFRELSFVGVPGVPAARVIKTGSAKEDESDDNPSIEEGGQE